MTAGLDTPPTVRTTGIDEPVDAHVRSRVARYGIGHDARDLIRERVDQRGGHIVEIDARCEVGAHAPGAVQREIRGFGRPELAAQNGEHLAGKRTSAAEHSLIPLNY